MTDLTEFCVCPTCLGELSQSALMMTCEACRRDYPIIGEVPALLPERDAIQQRYFDNYERIATDDLALPLETRRGQRHDEFLRFVGDLRGLRVLDVGSSYAGYLHRLDATLKVAFDIALPYLERVEDDGRTRSVQGDAEALPFRPGFFDAVLVSDILEHLLNPQAFVERLRVICRADTRMFVHVPWEEDLSSYRDSPYAFTHLRRFDNYTFGELWRNFEIIRRHSSQPRMDYPLSFVTADRLPLALAERLRRRYFHTTGVSEREFKRRVSRADKLPRFQRFWLRFYPPTFRSFELRVLERSTA